jgi:hypothetical protein
MRKFTLLLCLVCAIVFTACNTDVSKETSFTSTNDSESTSEVVTILSTPTSVKATEKSTELQPGTLDMSIVKKAYHINNFDIVSSDSYIEFEGDRYYEIQSSQYQSFEQLKSAVEEVFDKSWAEQKFSLFQEKDGKLYRYDGINSPYVKTKYDFENATWSLLEENEEEAVYVVSAQIIGSNKIQKFSVYISSSSNKISDFYFANDNIEENRYGAN